MSELVLVRNLCSLAKVAAAYEPLIASAVGGFRAVFTDDLSRPGALGYPARGDLRCDHRGDLIIRPSR